MGDLNARRGMNTVRMSGPAPGDQANVPLSNMFGYAPDLRSKTGAPNYSMEPSHYVAHPRTCWRRSSGQRR
jgi:elongation factor G